MPAVALGAHHSRAAGRAGLVRVQPRAYVAATAPVSVPVLVASVRASLGDREHAFLGATALWLLGAGDLPPEVHVGVTHTRRVTVLPPVRARRVSRQLLAGARTAQGVSVVRLEVAVVQACSGQRLPAVVVLLERLLRERRTTVARLRATCCRGVEGSAVVREALLVLTGGSLDRPVRQLRAALEARGIRSLEVEVRMLLPDGTVYIDLCHRPTRTALEVDGFLSHVDRARFRADRRRDRSLRGEHGVLTLRISVDEVEQDLDGLADELAALLVGPPLHGLAA